jgi:transcriptional regulator with XRE-family HTH domain
MGEQRLYRDQRHELGQQLLMLRTRVALTQSALAAELGVHRRSVQNWETGISYPKAEMLQRLIAVFLHHRALTPGQERAEAQALWSQAVQDGPHALPAFDEEWFAGLGTGDWGLETGDWGQEIAVTPHPPSLIPNPQHRLIDWGEVPAVPTLHGREREIATLHQWIMADRCRVVALLGIGGIGKSSLAITFAQGVVSQFDVVLFRSLQNGPPPAEVLDQIIRAVSDQHATPPNLVPDKIAWLVQLLRERHCLLILDNFDAILQPGALTGTYHTDYAAYGTLLQALSERAHQSCLLLTSRETPPWIRKKALATFPRSRRSTMRNTSQTTAYHHCCDRLSYLCNCAHRIAAPITRLRLRYSRRQDARWVDQTERAGRDRQAPPA